MSPRGVRVRLPPRVLPRPLDRASGRVVAREVPGPELSTRASALLLAGGVEDERLDGHAVDLDVDRAEERPHLAARQPLDRVAELLHRGVLEDHPGVAD